MASFLLYTKIQVILIGESILYIYNPVKIILILLELVGLLSYAHISSLQDKKANITAGLTIKISI